MSGTCDLGFLIFRLISSFRYTWHFLLFFLRTSWPPQEKLFIWSPFFQYNCRAQVAPLARR